MSPATAPTPTAVLIGGAAALLGPALFLLSDVAYLVDGGGINDGVLGGVIGVWSCFTLLIALIGVLRMLEPRAPRAAAVLTALAAIAFVGGTVFNVDAIHRGVTGGVDITAEHPLTLLAFLPWGLFAPLSLVLVGAFGWRSATGPRWAAVTLVVAGVLFGAGRPTGTVGLVLAADVAMVVAFGGLGVWMLRARRTVADRIPSGPLPA